MGKIGEKENTTSCENTSQVSFYPDDQDLILCRMRTFLDANFWDFSPAKGDFVDGVVNLITGHQAAW